MDQTTFHYSDALVDYSGLSKTLGDLEHSFSLLEFLDLCALLEGIILHDRLVVVGGDPLVSDPVQTAQPQGQQSAPSREATLFHVTPPQTMERWRRTVKPLVDAGILIAAPRTRPADLGPKPVHPADERGANVCGVVGHSSSPTLARSTKLDSWYEAGRLLGAERELGCPPLALIRQRPFYERGGQAKPMHTVCDLMGQYQDLASALRDLRTRTRLSMIPFLVVPIPPLPLTVLKLCSSYEGIVTRALDVREDYAVLRSSLRSLRNDLADDTISPKKKLSVIRSWERSWATLHQYDKQSSYVEFANSALGIADLSSAVDGVKLDSVRLSELLKAVAVHVTRAHYSWRVRLLHGVGRKYLSTPDSELGEQVARLFNVRVTQDQLEALQAHWGFC